MTIDEINRRFKYHPPNAVTQDFHNTLRDLVKEFAVNVDLLLPGESREKALFFTSLEESQFWAHAHLARNL